MSVRTYTYADRAAWLADRSEYVGASEVAACIGAPGAYLSRWELWSRKRNLLPPKEETERMRWGQRLEAAIAQGVADEHGGTVDVWENQVAYGPAAKPYQRATPDGTWVDADGVLALLEIKNVDGALREHWEDGPPPHVVCQVQWQLYCAGYDAGVAAALIGGNRLAVYRLERDDELIAALDEAVDVFWESVENGVEPTVEHRDVELLPLRWQAREAVVADLPIGLALELVESKEAEAAAKKRFNQAKAETMQTLGHATEGRIDGRNVCTWREDKAGRRVFRLASKAAEVVRTETKEA